MPTLPFKLNQAGRHHIPRQQHKVTNWPAYDASLRQRGSLTVWFTDEAITAWAAEPRTTRGGQPWYSELAILTALTLRAVFRLAFTADRKPDRLHHRPARPLPACAGPHHPQLAGRHPGGPPTLRPCRPRAPSRLPCASTSPHRRRAARQWPAWTSGLGLRSVLSGFAPPPLAAR